MRFITKKHLSRRTVLRGLGSTIALPLLDAMVPALTPMARAEGVAPTRFTGIFVPHGAAPGYWVPESSAKGFKFPYIYEPLAPFRDRTVITSGMWATASENPPGVTGADHFVASAFLCGVKPRKATGADVEAGTTLDQVIAAELGQGTLLPSLQLAVEDPGSNSSNCGEGYSCVYTNTISWQTPTRPLPMEINPQVVFERMFGDGATPEVRAQRRAQQRSVLDSLAEDLGGLHNAVASYDRTRLEQYLDDVREIERRLGIAAQSAKEAPSMGVPAGVPETFAEHIKLQFDLLALAYQADITRVATLLYARDLTGRVYPEAGTSISFHGGSHHAEDPAHILEFAKLNRYHVQTLAYFIDKLRKIPEGDGTLLDHSLTLYGSNMGDSNQHLHYDVPHVLIGGAGGRLKGDRHLAYPSKTVSSSNLLLSVLGLYGLKHESFGDSTGRIDL